MFRTDQWSVYGYLANIEVSMYEEAYDCWAVWVLWVAPATGVAVFVGDLRWADRNFASLRCGVTLAIPFGCGFQLGFA